MKSIILSLMFIAIFGVETVRGFDKSLFRFDSSIKSQTACLDKSYIVTGMENVRIDVELELLYENHDTVPIILDKRSGTVQGYNIYQKNADSTPGDLKRRIDFELLFSGELLPDGDAPGKSFRRLKRWNYHLSKIRPRLIFDHPDGFRDYEGQAYFVSFEIYTVEPGLTLAGNLDELRQRWSKKGYFWFENLETEPFLIEFPKYDDLKTCS